MSPGRFLLTAAEIAEIPELEGAHPLNRRSGFRIKPLADTLGLQRTGVHIVRLAAGEEANVYHSHACQEEFFYILEGRGELRADDETFSVGPGDFMAFPTPSVAHSLRNTGDGNLVYLVGGERKDVEIAEFPDQEKLLVRHGREAFIVDRSALQEFVVGERGAAGTEDGSEG